MNVAQPLIHVHDFHMHFAAKKVINGLSFDVARGETFGFLGSNGSGKTTTIRALLGIYRPTAGTLEINGKVFGDDFGSRLGYLPEERGLYKKESVIDVMTYFGRFKGLSRQEAKKFSRQYLDRVDLADKADVRVDKLSGGEQQKIQLGNPTTLVVGKVITLFIPFYIVSMVVSDPGSVIVQIFTFFPLTAPITAMLRNAFGSLDGVSATIVIAELFICGAVALRVAVHLFRYGSIEYSRKLSLRTAFARKP